MNIRKKIWIALSIALAGVVGPLFLLFAFILGGDFDRLAGELAKLHARRVAEVVAHQQRALTLLAVDWGEWDDAYAFLADRNEAFTDSNLTDDINEAIENDLVLILDTAGERVVVAAHTRAPLVSEELLRRVGEAVVGHGVTAADNDAALSGVIATPHGPLLFGASPVLTSEGEGPNRGAMVMARLVDDALVAQWRELLQGRFDLLEWSEAARELGAEGAEELAALEEVVRKRGDDVAGYGRLVDYAGRPVYLIRAETQRAVYAQGRTTLAVISALLFAALLLFAAMTVGLLERSVLSRLTRLDRAVARMDEEGGAAEVALIAAAGGDEVSRLAGTVDAMVGELARSLHEKEVLLREIHHRVKNNMQVISSLLNMQADTVDDPLTRHALMESRGRVRSMALVHDKLYRTERLSRIDFADYLRGLTEAIARSSGALADRVSLQFEMEPVEVGLDTAVSCGLVTNELISNAYEHAFADPERDHRGTLRITLRRDEEGAVVLCVADDGAGLPEGQELDSTATLGLRLVSNLVERQLGGELRVERGGGSAFHIRFHEQERHRS